VDEVAAGLGVGVDPSDAVEPVTKEEVKFSKQD